MAVHGHLWADLGATGEMLLGALVDAGASVEVVDEAVGTLGVGDVRLAWARLTRGDTPAAMVRVRAPQETPDVGSWSQVQRILEFAAIDDAVRVNALAATERLIRAEAEAANLAADELPLPGVGLLDALAAIVGTCAAVADLAITDLTVGVIGVGSGTAETVLGSYEVPTPATRALLAGFELESRRVPHELTSAVGASLLATLARPGPVPDRPPSATGFGAGERIDGFEALLRLDLFDVDRTPVA